MLARTVFLLSGDTCLCVHNLCFLRYLLFHRMGLVFTGLLCISDKSCFILTSCFFFPLLGGFLKRPAPQVVADSGREFLAGQDVSVTRG